MMQPMMLLLCSVLIFSACGTAATSAGTDNPNVAGGTTTTSAGDDGTESTSDTDTTDDTSSDSDAESHTSTCNTNAAPTFANALADPALHAVIVPLGSVGGNVIKAHTFLHIAGSNRVPVYAPADAQLTSLAYYTQTETDIELHLYTLQFQVSCEVSYYVDHLTELSAVLAAVAPSVPATTSHHVTPTASVSLRAGDVIGYVDPLINRSWDFGVLNTTKSLSFANNARYTWIDKTRYSDCPYDYFSSALRTSYYEKFGDQDGTIVPHATCRSAVRDVVGTMAGAWYLDAEGDATYSAQLAIASNFQGQVKVGGVSTIWDQSPDAVPEDLGVGASTCYANGSSYVQLRLSSATALDVVYGSGACPGSFPSSGYHSYVR